MAMTLLRTNPGERGKRGLRPAATVFSLGNLTETDDLLAFVTETEHEGMPEEMRQTCHRLRESLTLIAIETYLQGAQKSDNAALSTLIRQERERIAFLMLSLLSQLGLSGIA